MSKHWMGDKVKKSRQFIGTSIMDKKNGKLLGTIKDVVFMPEERAIIGFCVSCGKWFKNGKVLIPKRIHNIGENVITVDDENALLELEKVPGYSKAMKEKKRITGMKVITNGGDELGFLQDIIIDEENCAVGGYILTDGFFDDILYGKLVLPYSDSIIFGQDAIVVDSSSMNMVLKNDISFKKLFQNSEERLRK